MKARRHPPARLEVDHQPRNHPYGKLTGPGGMGDIDQVGVELAPASILLLGPGHEAPRDGAQSAPP